MPFYTPQGGSSSSSSSTGLNNLTVTGSPSNVLVIGGSPATGSNGVVTITIPQASAGVDGYLSAADFATLSGLPPWAVQRVSAADSTITFYSPSAQTDSARGIALQTALAVQSTGDLYILNRGNFTCPAASFYATGVTIRGQGMYTTTITHDGSANYFAFIAKNSCNISDLNIYAVSASAGRRCISVASGGSFNNIKIESHPTATIGGAFYAVDDASAVQQSKTYLNNMLFINGGIVAGRYQNLDISNTVVLARAEAAIGMNNYSTTTSRNSYYSNSGNFYTIGQLETTNNFISYGDTIINTTSGFAAVDIRFNASSYNINATTIKAVGTGIYGCNNALSNSPGSLQGSIVSGGLCSITHTSGGMYFGIGNSLTGPSYGNLSGVKGSTSYDFTNNVPRFHNGTEWTPQYPRGFTLGSYYVPDAYHIPYNTGTLPITPTLIYTVPTGYKAMVWNAFVYGANFNACRFNLVRNASGFNAGTADAGNVDQQRFIMRGGDTLWGSGVNFQTGGTGNVNVSIDILRMPSSILLDSSIANFVGTGYNILYTCPNGYNAMPYIDSHSTVRSVLLVNTGGTTFGVGEIHYVPSGGSPSSATQLYVTAGSIASGTQDTRTLGGFITPGMTIQYKNLTPGTTGTAFTTVQLTPV